MSTEHDGEVVNQPWGNTLRARAEQMRREPTRAEHALWQRLRQQPAGLTFWNQHVIANRYIADFFCPAARLVLEVDGDVHEGRAVQDRHREDVLHELGFRVARLSNVAVLADVDAAIARIVEWVQTPKALDAQRAHELARRRAVQTVQQGETASRQRPVAAVGKAKFRCTWCLADFVTSLAPAPACRRCPGAPVTPICRGCDFRVAAQPGARCSRCLDASVTARSAVGSSVEQVNRASGRHRVRKVL